MLRIFVPLLCLAFAAPAIAEDNADWRFGGDAYLAGRIVTLSGDEVSDLFAAGDKVTATSDVSGSAHMAGRYVTMDGRVGDNFYGAGMGVDLHGPVAGNATVMGQDISITEPVSGNLRATGQNVDLVAPVAGNAILAGELVTLDGEISGDVALSAAEVVWGDHAKVMGALDIYTDNPDSITVPASVADNSRVSYHEVDSFDAGDVTFEKPSLMSQFRGWLGGVLVIGILGTIFAAVAPFYLGELRERALAQPVKTGMVGFVGISALVGSVLLLAMTGIGAILIPISLILALLLGVSGYVVGAYVLGVWAVSMTGRAAPRSTSERTVAAFAGAALAALIALIPWIGWLAVMVIFLIGAGALVARITRMGDMQEAY
ncbi:MAG: hypothetical protein P8X51_00380 [Maritimibacter sp.]|jgi:hypothetical protein